MNGTGRAVNQIVHQQGMFILTHFSLLELDLLTLVSNNGGSCLLLIEMGEGGVRSPSLKALVSYLPKILGGLFSRLRNSRLGGIFLSMPVLAPDNSISGLD